MERIHIHKQNTTAGRGEKLLGGGGGGGGREISEFLVTFLGFLQIRCIFFGYKMEFLPSKTIPKI